VEGNDVSDGSSPGALDVDVAELAGSGAGRVDPAEDRKVVADKSR
jgi:hypothetical protein